MFLMMGTFHIILTFIAVIAIRFKYAGLQDVVIQSMIVAEGSTDTMFTGTRAYKRAVRVYKILYEALSRLLLQKFDKVYTITSGALLKILENADDLSDFDPLVSSKELQNYCTDLLTFKDKLAEDSLLAKFWLSFLEMCEVLLNLLYATRADKWQLYLEAVKNTLPWFFAYDLTNYSRFLTAHYEDLNSLEGEFPDVHEEFLNGNFSVQLSNTNPFGIMEADKVIETTINKDTKTPGGITGKKLIDLVFQLNLNYLSLFEDQVQCI